MHVNLVVIRSTDLERSAEFYTALGVTLQKHRHGNGENHYAANIAGLVFEI